MPMTLRTEAFRDNPRKLAVMYGPLVLCAPIQPQQKLPTVVAEPAEIPKHIEKVAGKTLTFLVRRTSSAPSARRRAETCG